MKLETRVQALPRIRDLLGKIRELNTPTHISLIGFAMLVLIVAVGPELSRYDPLLPAGPPFSPPSVEYWFGTDSVGRDVFTRVLYGMRTTLWATFLVIASGIAIGTLVGLISGMSGGLLDVILMRATDAFVALPGPLIAIAVIGILGPSLINTGLALVIVWWPLYARIV